MKFNLRGLLQDEEFLLGAGLLSAGSQGQSIGQAAFPSILQAAQVKKAFASDIKKTKAVLNTVTGQPQFATELQIQNSNGVLVPIPKQSTAPKIIIGGDVAEKEFEKVLGKDEAGFVTSVRKDGTQAIDQNASLDVLNELYAELNTGQFGTTLLDLSKLGQRFGVNMNWLSAYSKSGKIDQTIAKAEVLQVMSSSFVLDAIGKTKGSVSDKEMAFFMSLAPSLSMSPDGIKNVVAITKRINERKIEKQTLLDEWIADDTRPGQKKNVDGTMMTFNQMWTKHVNGKDQDGELLNPLFSKEEKDNMFNIAQKVDTDEGVQIIEYQGKKYYVLPDGNYIPLN